MASMRDFRIVEVPYETGTDGFQVGMKQMTDTAAMFVLVEFDRLERVSTQIKQQNP
ncbi:MAG: hypothetical protein KGJ60_01545 [Verrucomicrobiota bacterium]|nr:hypothetical protein [Verrucomicrobiota bacterium]